MQEAPITREVIRVRYAETDMMGHAYYGSYLPWLEQARGAWCRDRGFTYLSLEEQGLKLPVVEVWVRYKGEIKYDDDIVVEIWLEESRRATLKFGYRIVQSSDGRVCTEATTTHILVGEGMKPTSIPDWLRKKMGV